MGSSIRKEWVITIAALAIALFMTLPRLVIIAYFKANPHPRMIDVTWWDLGAKCFYAFLVAWLFLWLNTQHVTRVINFRLLKFNTVFHRILINLILLAVVKCVFYLVGLPEQSELRPGRGTAFLFNVSLVLEVVFCILAGKLYRLFRSNQDEKLKNEALSRAHAEATFEVLKNQVNPHFLFNSLNTINAMIDSDVNAAKRFVDNMSQVYRYVLNSSSMPVTTLGEELKFTKAYINMLLERHANGLSIQIAIPDRYYSFHLPPVSLQVLIENAVKHNVVSAGSPLTLIIEEDGGQIRVSNEVKLRKLKVLSTGTGLWNLNERYRHLCGTGITIMNNDGTFSVTLPLLQHGGDGYVPI